jgi:hypothetical protein
MTICGRRESALREACAGPVWSGVDDHGLLTSEVLYQLSYGGGATERVPRGRVIPRTEGLRGQRRFGRVGVERTFSPRWTASRAGGNVSTPEFVRLAERVSGQDLGAFFDPWLFTGAKPAGIEPAAARTRSAVARPLERTLKR